MRRTKQSLTEAQEDDVVRRYLANEPVLAISRDYPVHVQTLHNVLRRRGIATRPGMAKRRVPEAERALIVEACREATVDAVAARFGTSPKTVSRILREARAAGVDIVLPQGRPRIYTVNEAAFDAPTPESLYWTGFLFADGHVTADVNPRLICALAEKDRQHLEKLRSFLGSTHPIHHTEGRKAKGGPFAWLNIRSRPICKTLHGRGMVLKRTRAPTPETAASRDFWRGMVDGDGCLGTTEIRGLRYAYIDLAGQKPVIDAFCEFARSRCRAMINGRPNKTGCLWIAGTTGSTARALIETLYDEAAVALNRKDQRARAIILGDMQKCPPYVERACTIDEDVHSLIVATAERDDPEYDDQTTVP